MISSLYVHIPFCSKLCPYCGFYKEQLYQSRTQEFLNAVLREAEMTRFQPETVFFGGGTPTILGYQQLDDLFLGLNARLDLHQVKEWTVEMNPASFSKEKARLLLSWGVNRASIGVQSWDPQLLRTLGRAHTVDQSRHSYDVLREAGFSNINLDLIFGIPGQGIEQWRDSLKQTVALRPEHISAYCLTYEEETEYFLRLKAGTYFQDIDTEVDFFEETMTYLQGAGYHQYEISSYTLPGKECLHNLGYWKGKNYIGLGPSAFSTVGSLRWSNVADTAEYIKMVNINGNATCFREALSPAILHTERILFGLRTHEGIPVALVKQQEDNLKLFLQLGLIEKASNTVRLTQKGRLLADPITEALL